MLTKPRATVDDLYNVPEDGKAELVNGEIVIIPPHGGLSGFACGEIAVSLHQHQDAHGGGHPFTGKVAFLVDLPHRQSFCADVSWYTGNDITMDFLSGAPAFAVEIRSKGDYGAAAEQEMEDKRADYFAAGTLVVWDVDLKSADVIAKYTNGQPIPTIFRRGDVADAEPAVPGWKFPVDDLFA